MANIGFYDPDKLSVPILERLDEPLSNLHWKARNEPLKSINQLQLKFIEQQPSVSNVKQTGNIVKQNDQFYHNLILQSNNNRIPYVLLLFVKLGSIDEYRTKTRPMIKRWIGDNIKTRLINIEWLVIFVDNESEGPISAGKHTVFQKLKTDFNEEGENNCALTQRANQTSPEYNQNWAVLLGILKEKVLSSFTKRLELYQNQLSLLEERPVINPYFKLILKNHVMKIYNDMTLDEESLNACDELTSIFSRMIKEKTIDLPLNISTMDLRSFFGNLTFDNSIEFDKLILEGKMDTFQFYGYSFLHLSKCLILLARSDSSLTFSSLHVVELLRRVKLTVTSLGGLFGDITLIPAKVYQFFYILIEEYLSDKFILKTVELNLKNPEVGKLSDIMELIGELKMAQRGQLSKLGEHLNLKVIGLMEEINLDEGLLQEDFVPDYEALKVPLSSEEEFTREYLSMTRAIIEGFDLAGIRPRTIDILSTEIALISYNQGRYDETKEILSYSFKYYAEQGWQYIGSHLLRIFIDSLEKTGDSEMEILVNAYLDLLSTKSGIDKEAIELVRKIREITQKVKFTYPLSKLFDVNIDCKWNNLGRNKYYITLILSNKLKTHITVDKIALTLEDHHGNKLEFNRGGSEIPLGTKSYELSTNMAVFDTFRPCFLQITINGLSLECDLHEADLSITPQRIPGNSNLFADLTIPKTRKLNENSMLLTIQNGNTEIENLKVNFLCGNQDLVLELLDNDIVCVNGNGETFNISISKQKDQGSFCQLGDKIRANDVLQLTVPYVVKYTNQELLTTLKIKYLLSFSQGGETHTYKAKEEIDPFLSVAVTVQDIFKSSILFTNFSVGSTDSKNPIKILGVNLGSSRSNVSNYQIEAPEQLSQSVVAFSGQPVKFFYKIRRLGKEVDEEELYLTIKYRNLREECIMLVKKELLLFLKELGSSSFDHLQFSSRFWNLLEFKLSFYDLKGLVKMMPVVCEAFLNSKEDCQLLEKFSEKFVTGNGFQLQDIDFSSIERTLIISVPMPLIPVIHETELKFERFPNYMVGTPIKAKLFLKTTTSWSGKPAITSDASDDLESKSTPFLGPPTPIISRPTSPGLDPTSEFVNGDGKYWERGDMSSTSTVDLNLEDQKLKKKKKMVTFEKKMGSSKCFQLELQTSDNWLLSGNKKFTFHLVPNGTHEFELPPISLVLVPLKVGRIPLPKVEIKLVENGEIVNEIGSLEVDYRNSSETLVVVSDVDKMTLDL